VHCFTIRFALVIFPPPTPHGPYLEVVNLPQQLGIREKILNGCSEWNKCLSKLGFTNLELASGGSLDAASTLYAHAVFLKGEART
jgi:hypothetical protein